MRKNIGESDQVLRLALGSALLVISLAAGEVWWWLLLLPVAVLYVTAFVQVCPLYVLLGIDTFRPHRQRTSSSQE